MTVDATTLQARLSKFADELESDWGCDHTPEFRQWCSRCEESVVKDIRDVLLQLAHLTDGSDTSRTGSA